MSYEVVDLVDDTKPLTQTTRAVYVSEVIDLVSPRPKQRRPTQEVPTVDLTLSKDEETSSEVEIQKEIVMIRVPAGVKCPVCLDVREDQISGDCGHALCIECMNRVMQTTKKCPSCRRPLKRQTLRRIFWNY